MSTTNKTIQDRIAETADKTLDRVEALIEDHRYAEANAALELVNEMTRQVIKIEDHVISFDKIQNFTHPVEVANADW